MFGLGAGEILLILVIALIVLGPAKLPEIAKQLGKGLREFRKATSDFQRQVHDEIDVDDAPRSRTVPPARTADATKGEPPAHTRGDLPVEVEGRPPRVSTPEGVVPRGAPVKPEPAPIPPEAQTADADEDPKPEPPTPTEPARG